MDPSELERLSNIVARARTAQRGWAALPLDKRVRAVSPLKSRVLERAETIAACVHDEVGKPEVEALLGEVLPSADVVEYWTDAIPDLMEPSEVRLDPLAYPRKQGTVEREPRGVVGVIMPWNFPIALPLRTIVPALLAGNAIVFKPSEVTPRSGALLGELLAGLLPEGLFAVLQGDSEHGAALCRSDVDVIVFTGSALAGRKVARACAERLVPCSLELGGKDAAIVLRDADLDRTARGVVWGAMMNAGQNCAAVERVYVERSIADAFTTKVCEVVASLRVGIDVGSLATRAQRAVVAAHVDEAKARGAVVLAGGAAPADESSAYPPTVVRVDRDDMALMQEETFGPVLPIAVVDTVDEAVDRANASRFGLTASIWTRNWKAGREIAHRLRAGVVTVNNHAFTGALPAAPWSGRGESGWGITSSPFALDALTRPRFVLVDRSRAARELWWFPYTPTLRSIGVAMATLRCSARNMMDRLRALFGLARAMMRRARER